MDNKFGNGLIVGLVAGVICGTSFGQVLENDIRQIA